MIEDKLYKHSGISTVPGFILVLGLGAILAILLAFVYNLLIVIIPIVYINFLVTVIFSAVLGYGIKFFSRFAKIRNEGQSIILAGIIGFIGFYFQWIAYFVFLNSGGHSIESYLDNANLIYNPAQFIDFLVQLNRMGSWEMFGIVFTDFPLWIIWGSEALIIIGIPMLIAYKHPIIPFSESLNKWYRKYILKKQFERISAQNQFKEMLFQDVEQTIQNLDQGAPFRFSEVSIYYLKDEQKQYLSLDNLHIEDQGKGKTNRTPVIHLVEIDNRTANALMEKFGTKKQFALDY